MSTSGERIKLAARISNPWGGGPPPSIEPHVASDVACILGKSSASLLPLQKRCGEALTGSALLPFIREEEVVFRRLREEFETVRAAFEGEGIRTIFIKSTGLFPSFPHLSSNLDVLVPSDAGDMGRKMLRDLGYVELLNAEEPKKFLFRRFSASAPSYTFHLHEQVGWGVPFLDTHLIWERARAAPDDPTIEIPGPIEALLITLSHWFYEDKALSLGNLFHTAHALRSLPCTLEEASGAASVRGWEDGFYASIEVFRRAWREIFDEDFFDARTEARIEDRLRSERLVRSTILRKVRFLEDEPARIPFWSNKLVYYKKILADSREPFASRLRAVFVTLLWGLHLKARIRSQRSFLISISGCDGSGKTLQAGRLKEAFETCEIRTKAIWSRGGSSVLMSVLTRVAKRLFSSSAVIDSSSQGTIGPQNTPTERDRLLSRRQNLRNPILRFLYSALYGFDLALLYLIKARLLLLSGNVVICDRYTADSRVDFAISSGKRIDQSPLALTLLEVLAPKPDLSFILDVEETEALRRKPEEGDIGHLAESRGMFLTIAERRRMIVMPPDASWEILHEKITLESLSRYYRGYRTLLNALFLINPNQLNPGRRRE